jgi:hypothetical protein
LRGIEEEPSISQSVSREPKARDRFRNSVSLVGYPRRKMLGEDGRGLTKEGSTKSPLGIEISHRRTQIAMEKALEPSVLHGRERSRVKNC